MKVSRKISWMNRFVWIIGPLFCYLINTNSGIVEAFIAPTNHHSHNHHPHRTVYLGGNQHHINLPQLSSLSLSSSLGRHTISTFHGIQRRHQRQPALYSTSRHDDDTSSTSSSTSEGIPSSDVESSSLGPSSLPSSSLSTPITPSTQSSQQDAISEAERLRTKARDLMDEANRAETKLRDAQKQLIGAKNEVIDLLIDEFLSLAVVADTDTADTAEPVDTTTTASANNTVQIIDDGLLQEKTNNLLRQKQLSPSRTLQLIERLIEREIINDRRTINIIDDLSSSSSSTTTTASNTFNIGDVMNSMEYRTNEAERLEGWVERIIDAQLILDDEGSLAASSQTDSTTNNKNKLATKLKVKARDLRKTEQDTYQRQLALKLNNRALSSSSPTSPTSSMTTAKSMDKFVQQTLGVVAPENVTVTIDGRPITGSQQNMTNLVNDIINIPLWVPTSLLPFLIASRDTNNNPIQDQQPRAELTTEDFKRIKTEVLMGSRFRCDSWDSMRLAAVYRGDFVRDVRKARVVAALGDYNGVPRVGSSRQQADNNSGTTTNNDNDNDSDTEAKLTASIFLELQQRLTDSGLGDKLQLFLLPDPEWRPEGMSVGMGSSATSQRNTQELLERPPPVILAMSRGVVPEQGSERGLGIAVVAGLSIVSTIVTIFAYAISGFALNPTFFHALVDNNDISVLTSCLPIAIGVVCISLLHEVIHVITARRTGIKIGLPVPLPSLQIGTFGSITPLRSFPQSRSNLFDLAIAAPLITAAVSIMLIVVGLSWTISTPAEVLPYLGVIPVAILKSSFLVGSIVTAIAPKLISLPLSQPIPIHPIVMIGLSGLLSSAINLLPLGRLDGGRASIAIFGRRTGYFLSLLTLTFLAILALTGSSTISIFWGLIVTLFQRDAEIPVRDDLSAVDDVRFGVYVASLCLVGLVLAPFPGGAGML